ncbi:hypothetical protein B0F87_10595 [Methylobacter tundripaludum]|uniref:Preprotein translocase subunit SecB n=1 Tax=Methylobacter tundripaludum TaxID=173365 RepID=A0A2S6HDW2_9GAMM|nr:preprotein translocase subunit SecB [Methylobacter tundripaludum]PPK75626.1 hypothetical protein B0F87_10595 [Methylobacter tundripaludum]
MNANLQKAIDSLDIHDVYLRGSIAKCFDDFDPKYNNELEKLAFQTKHIVKQSEVVEVGKEIVELKKRQLLLRVFIDFGVRWVDTSIEDEAQSVCAMIEAEFVAEYVIKEEMDQACIDEYARKNASYHVWPYWREFLMNQCNRMHLPRLVLPAMQLAHNRHQPDN